MLKKFILAGIAGLVLVGGPAADSIAAPPPDECKGPKPRPASCEVEETPGGQHRSLRVTLDDDGTGSGTPIGTADIKGDSSAVYRDSQKTVSASLGGQTQPNKPGFQLSLKRKGPDSRAITAKLTCAGLPNGGPNFCTELNLPPNGEVTDDTMSLSLRPYEVGCPDELSNSECPDVFTMGESAQLMSFRINFWNQNIFIEVASAIGGANAPNPGRCLSLLNTPQNFLNAKCVNPGDCDVNVVAYDNGDFAGAGVGDGENDRWHIDAINAWALICNMNAGFVYGMAKLNFGAVAIKE